ncbi:TPA: hypothetical protein ACTXXA_000456 [Legionella anisa]
MPSIHEIEKGTDITKHYLDAKNEKFKIFRYEKNVYAIQYDDSTKKPVDFVHMWHSDAREDGVNLQDEKIYGQRPKIYGQYPTILGSGSYGNVYERTKDKVFKINHVKINMENIETDKANKQHINMNILEQKFLLKEHQMEQYFILGLWNVKNYNNGNNEVFFNMPKVVEAYPDEYTKLKTIKEKEEFLKGKYEEFVLILKKLNNEGYCHPDLASINRHSPQNLVFTKQCIKIFDLDEGFRKNGPPSDKDQWIFAYTDRYRFEMKDQNYREKLKIWYTENNPKSLSENREALLTFYKNGIILLPKSVVQELKAEFHKPILSGVLKSKNSNQVSVDFSSNEETFRFIKALKYLQPTITDGTNLEGSNKPWYKITERTVLFNSAAWELVENAKKNVANENLDDSVQTKSFMTRFKQLIKPVSKTTETSDNEEEKGIDLP